MQRCVAKENEWRKVNEIKDRNSALTMQLGDAHAGQHLISLVSLPVCMYKHIFICVFRNGSIAR